MIRKSNIFLNSIFLIFIASCASIPQKDYPNDSQIDRQRVLESTPQIIEEKLPDLQNIKDKIKGFRSRLAKGNSLTLQDWQLHDQLLQAYIDLKSMLPGNVITVPAHSRKEIHLQTFCLDPGISAPVTGERFVWRKEPTEIPYLKQIIDYGVSHPEITQPRIQELIWNLKKGTRWERYPEDMQRILSDIDPQTNLKLPSELKDQLGAKARNYAIDKLKEWGLGQQEEKLAKGFKSQYDDIAKIQRDLQNLKSNYPLGLPNELAPIHVTSLYADTHTYDYNIHDITFYNPTDQPISIDLTQYYLQSTRPDVQRIALKKEVLPEDKKSEVIRNLEDMLYGDMLRLGVGFVPLVGDAADLYELFYGKDSISGQELTWEGRLLSGLGLIAGSGSGYRYALRVINSPGAYINEFEKGFSQALGKKVTLDKLEIEKANKALSEVREDIFKESKLISHEPPEVGQKVYRIYGKDVDKNIDGKGSGPFGNSWTPINPDTMPDARGSLGLPNQNKGRFVMEGRILDVEGIKSQPAKPLHSNPGGDTEYIIPTPEKQIKIEKVSGVNKEY